MIIANVCVNYLSLQARFCAKAKDVLSVNTCLFIVVFLSELTCWSLNVLLQTSSEDVTKDKSTSKSTGVVLAIFLI